jgi:thiol-disulfide isomerase/thioredoxin
MMKIIVLLILLSLPKIAFPQEIHELKIGEQVPNITLENFLDDTNLKLKLSKLQGKLIILDFWNDKCSNCIAAMPRMNSLQKQFNDKIQIIYVTKNSREQVLNLFSRIKMAKPQLPFIVKDTILNRLFPHNGDPLHVWINQKGYVHAITFDYNTNPVTVKEFLDGKNPHLSRRRDFGISLEYPLVSEQNSNILDLAKNYSILFTGLNEYLLGTSLHIDKNTSGKVTSVRTINSPLLSLYNIAYDNEIFNYDINFFSLQRNNRIILEVKDSSDFFVPTDEIKLAGWIKKNILSYEIKIPANDDVKIFNCMQQDLDKYLPYTAKIEKRKVKCLVLRKINNENFKAIEKYTGFPSVIRYNNDNSISFSNISFPAFVMQLIYDNTDINTPIIDETQIVENINMVIHCKLYDLKTLKIELQKYGLALKKEDCLINMLVISDKM